MLAHAKLSPSSSARWLTCTASIKACMPYENKGNSASNWGSACHFIGESILLDALVIPSIDDELEGSVVDAEMITTAEDYADYVRSFITEDSILLIEERFDLTFIAPNTFGTGDATILDDTHLHVMDLKSGRNLVYAKDNTQMMLYALGALEKFKDEFIEEVTLHIVQTRVGHIDTWTVSVEKLMEFREHAKAQATKIINDDTEYSPNEKACQWCSHKANCEKLAEHVESVVTGEFENLDEINGQADKILAPHIEKILANKDLIISFIKAVEDKALEDMQNGIAIDGYKLVRSKKHKRWTDKDKVEAYLIRKLKRGGAFKETLITPAQAIKALGKDNIKYIEKLIEIPEGDIVLALEDDKREAVQNIAEQFEEIS